MSDPLVIPTEAWFTLALGIGLIIFVLYIFLLIKIWTGMTALLEIKERLDDIIDILDPPKNEISVQEDIEHK